jgi:hypothetical protein
MICKTHNVAQSFERLKILLDLEKRFKKEKTFIGLAVMTALNNKMPGEEIIRTLKSQMVDNPAMMKRSLGDSLYYRIENF